MFLEFATDATDATEVVQKWWLRPHLPRTPGARMTVVTQTPSNYYIAILLNFYAAMLLYCHIIIIPYCYMTILLYSTIIQP